MKKVDRGTKQFKKRNFEVYTNYIFYIYIGADYILNLDGQLSNPSGSGIQNLLNRESNFALNP